MPHVSDAGPRSDFSFDGAHLKWAWRQPLGIALFQFHPSRWIVLGARERKRARDELVSGHGKHTGPMLSSRVHSCFACDTGARPLISGLRRNAIWIMMDWILLASSTPPRAATRSGNFYMANRPIGAPGMLSRLGAVHSWRALGEARSDIARRCERKEISRLGVVSPSSLRRTLKRFLRHELSVRDF